jgi:hypothetical protein
MCIHLLNVGKCGAVESDTSALWVNVSGYGICMSLEFVIDLILLAALWLWGRLSL